MAEKNLPETRLLLIGKTGSGKSSTGNSILGEKVFKTLLSFTSSTITSSYEERTRHDRRLVVVDTPGFYDTVKTNQEIVKEITKVFGYLSNGFHAMIYVINTDRFTQESIKTKKLFFQTFGQDVRKYTIIVLTHFDRIKESEFADVDGFLKTSGPEFTTFLKTCGNRLVAFNNKAKGSEMDSQVKELIGIVDKVVRENYGNVYTSFHLKLVRAFTRIERRRRKDLQKARKELFSHAVRQLGMERMIDWSIEEERPMRRKALEDQVVLQKSVVVPMRQTNSRSKIKPTLVKSIKNPSEIKSVANVDQAKNIKDDVNETGKKCIDGTKVDPGVSKFNHPRDRHVEEGDKDPSDRGAGMPEKAPSNIEVDPSGLHDEYEDEVHEQREAVNDGNFLTKLVDFFAVFIENLIK